MTDLRRVLGLATLDRRRIAWAVLAGVATLGSALALSALSAWLILRAWQMPPVLHLTVAVVAVRALGISRGICRYLERLATHDVAFRGTVALRAALYRALAQSNSTAAWRFRRGDLVVRTGEDVDAIGDVVVRALVPAAVAAVLAVASVTLLAVFSPTAAVILAGCLVLAGIVAPILTARAQTDDDADHARARAEAAASTVVAIESAAELRVAGRLAGVRARAAAARRDVAAAEDRAARWSALAAAAGPLATGVAVVGSLMVGTAAYGSGTAFAGGTSPMSLGIVVLVPLAAFEATSVLPAAAVAVVRGRLAARRIAGLLDQGPAGPADPAVRGAGVHLTAARPELVFDGVVAGYANGRRTAPVTATIGAGERVALVGPSGVGKTSMALTAAGLLPARAGTVRLGDATSGRHALSDLDPADVRGAVTWFAEDARVFETTVFENLRVVRGDLTAEEALAALDATGLGTWVRALPARLDTVLAGGDRSLSGGQRRRLLLARVVVSRTPVVIVDEPTEHLDDASSARLLGALLDPRSGLLDPATTALVITHRPVPAGVRTVTIGEERRDADGVGAGRVHPEKKSLPTPLGRA
ncbi:thiol reductant ABC exporter subunit CydC [Rhodococcoides corynebacterioides]|uniref:thiol reductant ABC exporter subunit CydC n=1 Tax=Rhodococcoides corynebacterioides TaxID=53972 RepID=UPI001C9AB6FE|nr:thiol reductant ABC exporter subunit CydC [Rhodococcus corynebacterioides]MBY6348840.1 thiol reductant ABC exporter subunit CydC [Rhodococcus corynebacterioides]